MTSKKSHALRGCCIDLVAAPELSLESREGSGQLFPGGDLRLLQPPGDFRVGEALKLHQAQDLLRRLRQPLQRAFDPAQLLVGLEDATRCVPQHGTRFVVLRPVLSMQRRLATRVAPRSSIESIAIYDPVVGAKKEPLAEAATRTVSKLARALENLSAYRLHDVGDRLSATKSGAHSESNETPQTRHLLHESILNPP